jgi:hypothetical protein
MARFARRFRWLVTEHARLAGTTVRELIRDIDELIEIGAGEGKIAGVSLEEFYRGQRNKKPSTAVRRARATGNEPGHTNSKSSIAGLGEKQ